MWKKWIAALASAAAGTGLAAAQAPTTSGLVRPSSYSPNGPTSAALFEERRLPDVVKPPSAPPPGPTPCAAPVDDDCCVPRTWVSAEYLLWWLKDGPVPSPLLTTGDPTDPVAPAALGQPG